MLTDIIEISDNLNLTNQISKKINNMSNLNSNQLFKLTILHCVTHINKILIYNI
jgi:hypothetical protein